MSDFTCPECGHGFSAPAGTAGQAPTCPQCNPPPRNEADGALPTTAVWAARQDAVPVNRAGSTLDFLGPPQGPDELGRLGPYRVLRVLGAGGMGLVLHAEDLVLRRPVALKIIRPGVDTNPTTMARFLREARAAAALRSDHVVTVYQVGEANGVPYLAMEFLHGESLEQRLKREPALTLAGILRIGRELAQGLAAAHERGLIHRDIKPANVWLESAEGGASAHGARAKILDFGLARAAAGGVQLTRSGAVLGTPAYMAPEQARGEKVDHRCDLFSLGVVLYRACTGKLPFHGRTVMDLLKALATEAPVPLRDLNPEMPAELADLVHRLMAKDPAQRPATAEEVAQRLQAIERGLTDAALRPGAAPTREDAGTADTPSLPRTERKVPRSWPFLLIGIVTTVAGSAAILSTKSHSPPTRSPAEPTVAAPKTRPAATPSQAAARPRLKVFLLAGQSDMVGRGAIRTLDWLGQDPKYGYLLKKIKKADDSWVVRNDVWVYRVHNSEPVNKGPLTVGYGQSANEIGPELLFGHVMADHFKSQVLLIKVTQGDMSLALECRPPSSGGPMSPGPFYKRMRETVSLTLAELKKHFPAYEDQGYELAGFVWFQGWNDMILPTRRAEYEANLANLIRDLRKDLGVPQLPVVIGEMGIEDPNVKENILLLRSIQAAVARRPEFKDTVVLAPTVQYWDMEADKWYRKGWDSARNKWKDQEAFERFTRIASQPAFMYFGSGKIYALLGFGFGEAMTGLCPVR